MLNDFQSELCCKHWNKIDIFDSNLVNAINGYLRLEIRVLCVGNF